MHPRVLIVGTVPYDPGTSSRAFDAYFHNWERENLRQIFSSPNKPIKGHCSSLFQITDYDLLKKRVKKVFTPGTIFNYEDCLDKAENASAYKNNGSLISKLYKLGANKTSLNHLARKALWKEKYWKTDLLLHWLDDFNPECVFLAFSDDFFINEIALFVADRFGIPIMCCIGDDYYFNERFSLSPFYHIYKKKYKDVINKVFSHRCSAIYISDKIRDKYNSYFKIQGETVYLTSSILRHEFRTIDRNNPLITYCGNIRLGRNKSLVDVAKALSQVNESFTINVFSGETSRRYLRPLLKCPNIVFSGAIPYKQVQGLFEKSDIVLIVEGFGKKDINMTRYSLSTKAADSIASGCQILTYGSLESGVIEYMKSIGCSVVATSYDSLLSGAKKLFFDVNYQKSLYEKAERVFLENHNLERSNLISERLINDLVNRDD